MYYRRSNEEVRAKQKQPHQLVVLRSFVGDDPVGRRGLGSLRFGSGR